MTIENPYASLADVKAALRITDTVDDALLEISIEAASREIDGWCERVFYSTNATRVYRPDVGNVVQIDDCAPTVITAIKTPPLSHLMFSANMDDSEEAVAPTVGSRQPRTECAP